MQKFWADEPPKSKPWVLSTSTASISMPSQELGRNLKRSGVKPPKTVSIDERREVKPPASDSCAEWAYCARKRI